MTDIVRRIMTTSALLRGPRDDESVESTNKGVNGGDNAEMDGDAEE